MFCMVDWQNSATYWFGFWNVQIISPVSTLTGGRLDIIQSSSFYSPLISYKGERSCRKPCSSFPVCATSLAHMAEFCQLFEPPWILSVRA